MSQWILDHEDVEMLVACHNMDSDNMNIIVTWIDDTKQTCWFDFHTKEGEKFYNGSGSLKNIQSAIKFVTKHIRMIVQKRQVA